VLVGIISDTHGWLHPEVHDVFASCDLILHAGDVGTGAVLDELETVGPPVRAVYGNVDGWDVRHRAPEHQKITVQGLRVWMTHIGGRPGRWAKGIGQRMRADRPDVFICGHSHILRMERVESLGGMLYVNPGAAGRQGFHTVKTCLRIRLANGAAREAEVIHLS
jgi:uncharacterized protein